MITPVSYGDFGPVFDQFKNKPVDAIRYLIGVEQGECINALYRRDIGYIDIVWGDNDLNNKGFGLKHIIEKHGKEIKQLGFEVENFIPILVQYGNFKKSKESDKLLLESEMFRVIIKTVWNGKEKKFLLSAFDLRKEKKSFGISGTSGDRNFTDESLLHQTNDSDKYTNKFEKSSLGSTNILEQNKNHTDLQGFNPTYKHLENYDHLIAPGSGKALKIYSSNDLKNVLEDVKNLIGKYSWEVKSLAQHLKATDIKQSVFNVWHFCVTNIKYQLEPDGEEILRTPSKSWRDRLTPGIDCDCFTILTCSLLKEMGYSPSFAVIAQNGTNNYTHIYTVINSSINGLGIVEGGLVCDPVMYNQFNRHPDNISKSILMKVSNLDGLGVNEISKHTGVEIRGIWGLGELIPKDKITEDLMGYQTELLKRAKNQNLSGLGAISKELRKTRAMIMLNGTEERDDMLPIMGLVEDITPMGYLVFPHKEYADIAQEYHDALVDDEREAELQGLGELGKRRKKAKTRHKFFQRIKDVVKNVGKGIKAGVKTIVKGLVKFNPLTIAARNGVLLAMKLNFRNLARKASLGLETDAGAAKRGYGKADLIKAREFIAKFEKVFEKIGGKAVNLRTQILKGKDKKPFMGGKGISGLGVTGADDAALIAAASSAIAALAKFISGSGIKFGKKESDTPGDESKEPPKGYDTDLSWEEQGFSSEKEYNDYKAGKFSGDGDGGSGDSRSGDGYNRSPVDGSFATCTIDNWSDFFNYLKGSCALLLGAQMADVLIPMQIGISITLIYALRNKIFSSLNYKFNS